MELPLSTALLNLGFKHLDLKVKAQMFRVRIIFKLDNRSLKLKSKMGLKSH